MQDDDDATLRGALASFFIAQLPRLRRRLAVRTGSVETAEDLAHDAWLRLHRNAAAALQAPGPYLYRTAENLAIDEARRRSRRLGSAEIEDILSVPAELPEPERAVIARDDLRAVIAAIAELPERRRQVFIAARLRGERYSSIAARHGITTRTVENDVRRALDHCAASLQRPLPKGDPRP
ncbi:MAG: RNA polymerase sigma factor [Pseudomonadota bacterium]